MKVRILKDTAVSPNFDRGERHACAFPSVCRLKNGDLLCGYRRGKEKHSRDGVFIVQRSTDGGGTWSEPVMVYDGIHETSPESVHAGTVVQSADGTSWAMFTAVAVQNADAYIFSEQGRQLDQRFYVAGSTDHGLTWEKATQQTITGAPSLTYINSRPLLLNGGDLLVPLEATTARKQQAALVGHFNGVSFETLVSCADDETRQLSFGDPKLVRLSDGRIVMFLWTFRNDTEETVAIHQCESRDNGVSWTPPRPTQIHCQMLVPLVLRDDLLVAVGNVRIPPEGVFLWSSHDEGKTWDPPIQMWDARANRINGESIDNVSHNGHPDGKLWEALPSFTFGTPDLVETANEELVLTYYAVINGICHVRACRFEIVREDKGETKHG